jgi:tetratricopeptide (TPR) repeat protein
MCQKLLLILFIFCSASLSHAQKADEELAAQFLAAKEYEKAADKYEKLLANNPRSMYLYDNLLKSYIGLNDLNSAQKLAKKQAKKFEGNYFYLVDEGYLLKIQNQADKANTVFNKLIQGMPPLESKVFELAKAFEKRGLISYAVEAYLNSRKALDNNSLYASELSGLYLELGDKRNFIEEALQSLVPNEQLLEEIEGMFQNTLESNEEFEMLKTALTKKTKQFPDKYCFQELLIWMHVQKNEYELASIYAKALDKKNKEEGRRLLELGLMASNNQKYDAAIHIYKQIQAQGKDKPYYNFARTNELESRTRKLIQGNYTKEDLIILENEFKQNLLEYGINPINAPVIKQLANLQAFYLNKYEDAIINYETLLKMPRLDKYLQAQVKLELGDLYILKNEVWESMLLYGQVDKEFLEEPIGQEAKFRNAKLSYYLGEFDWAKAQLDVLKTATTQLISNNAIELSLLIQDNTIDSLEIDPLLMFAKADLNFAQNNFIVALQILDSLITLHPKSKLMDDIYYKKAEIALKQKDHDEAARMFQKVFENYGDDILGDNALYNLAWVQQNKLNLKQEALKNYEKFIEQYPGSFFLNDCVKQFRQLRGDQIN